MTLNIGQLGRAPHLPTQIADLIARQISQGRLKTGDRLPTEHSLAKTFGVSRNVVREAISRLKSDGLIRSRQGVGAFVTGVEQRTAFRIDGAALRDGPGLRHLFELRGLLEIDAAGLAAERRDQAQLRALKAALDRMHAARGDALAEIETDIAFHQKVAAATNNSYMVTFVSYITGQIRASIRATQDCYSGDLYEITLQEHDAVYQAIESGDADRARQTMRDHILGAAKRLNIPLCAPDEFL